MSNTGIAVLCFQLLGRDDDSACKRGVKALEEASVDWDDADGWALYAWYYITQAKFHEGGGDWSKWNREFSRVYTRNQNEDGSWISPGRHEESHGKTYATALAALTLQVYYRHLPTFQVEKSGASDVEEVEEEEEDLIQII
jgi:hypothetical protein